MGDKKVVKVLDKTLDILSLFLEKQKPLGITEISKELVIYKSSVHRILNTLKSRGYIIQDPETKKYWLGSQFYSLGMLYKNKLKLRDIVNKYMKELAAEFKETIHLAMFDEMDYCRVMSLEKIEAGHRLSIAPPAGSRSPTFASAVGKALLAYSNPDIQNTVLTGPLPAFTENTITDRNRLEEELKEIKRRGYAVDNEELESGLVCLAAPILNEKKESVASISVSGPKGRIIKQKEEIIERLKNAVRQISYELK